MQRKLVPPGSVRMSSATSSNLDGPSSRKDRKIAPTKIDVAPLETADVEKGLGGTTQRLALSPASVTIYKSVTPEPIRKPPVAFEEREASLEDSLTPIDPALQMPPAVHKIGHVWSCVIWFDSTMGQVFSTILVMTALCAVAYSLGAREMLHLFAEKEASSMDMHFTSAHFVVPHAVILSICSFMVLEVALRGFADGLKFFLSDCYSVLDLIISSVALGLECVLSPFGGLVLVLRLLRIVGIIAASQREANRAHMQPPDSPSASFLLPAATVPTLTANAAADGQLVIFRTSTTGARGILRTSTTNRGPKAQSLRGSLARSLTKEDIDASRVSSAIGHTQTHSYSSEAAPPNHGSEVGIHKTTSISSSAPRPSLFIPVRRASVANRNSTSAQKNKKTVNRGTVRLAVESLEKLKESLRHLADGKSLAALIDDVIAQVSMAQYSAGYRPNVEDEGDELLQTYIQSHFSVHGFKAHHFSVTSVKKVLANHMMSHGASHKHGSVKVPSHETELPKKQLKVVESLCDSLVVHALQNFESWDFDIFNFWTVTKGNALVASANYMFEKYNLFNHFSIAKETFYKFTFAIQAGYRESNPYHNALHGADIGQAMCWLLNTGGLAELYKLTHLEKMACIVAAIIHDFKHPGVNNAFAMRKNFPVAILANDASILENFHVSQAFFILQKADHNIFSSLPEHKYRKCRNDIVSMVLSTDMAHHFEHMTQLHNKLQASPDGRLVIEEPADKTMLLQMAMHWADISNPARAQPLAQRWGMLICEEFFRQGDMEKSCAIPVSPMYDRELPTISKSQRGFIQYIVKPFTTTMAHGVMSQAGGEEVERLVNENLAYWNSQPEIWTLPRNVIIPEGLIPPLKPPNPEVEMKKIMYFGIEPIVPVL